jgi:adenine-specific DNA-methyltransferase
MILERIPAGARSLDRSFLIHHQQDHQSTMKRLDPKTDGASADVTAEHIEALKALFPECVTEGKVDFDILRELLGDEIEERPERYSFNWNGKSRARRIAQTPSTGTLRPCPEESVNWDTTQNIFIEGDNLEVLKLLQKSYHKRVKMIYIDPPYNTGNEFIYPDKYQDNLDTYLRYTGQTDDKGLKLSSNAETSGRYHTNWLNMMLPRLKLARNLLSDDGVIFISIDDHEARNLRALCDEVFGDENFVATLIWQKVFSPKNTAKHFSEDHDYIVVYARSKDEWTPELLPRSDDAVARYSNPDSDPRGPWASSDLAARNYYGEGRYTVIGPTGREFEPGKGLYWRHSKEKFHELDRDRRIWWGEDGSNTPRLKRFLSDVKDGVIPQTLLLHKQVGHTQEAKKELLEFAEFEETENILNSVKPTRLLRHLLKVGTCCDSAHIVVDFFAGSAPLGHACLLQNREDGGNRRFILVQLPEPLPVREKTASTIFDIGKSRLRNVTKALFEHDAKQVSVSDPSAKQLVLGAGFRVFSLDASNIKPWDADFNDLEPSLLAAVENIKPDRTELDILYELLLKYGLDLAVPVEERTIEGKTVYVVGGGALIVCLADEITLEAVEGIAALKLELQPEITRVVFKDAGFPDDVVKTNTVQILRQAGIEDVKSL